MGPGDLSNLMKTIKYKKSARVLVGYEESDDCGVIDINGIKLLQTVDIITPIVNEPYIFGQIAATNALSDIYAMGGQPVSALNIACFPIDCLDINILREILEGGRSKIEEANLDIIGGHTITDKEIKYGLSVLGVSERKIFTNNSAKAYNDIILTKPIGGGILSTALKAELINVNHKNVMIEYMTRLNKYAISALDFECISTVTDVTGFGLLGHLYEIAKASKISIDLYYNSVPFMEGFFDYVSYGLIPAGSYRNREFVVKDVEGDNERILLLSTPETSGGLLIFCDNSRTDEVIKRLCDVGEKAVKIGETKPLKDKLIFIK